MTPPNPPNDPRHWARRALQTQPQWPAVRLVPLALELFLEHRDLAQGALYLEWENLLIALNPDSPCIERATVVSGPDRVEFTHAFFVCPACQETLMNMVMAWWNSDYVASHPEWEIPNPARLLEEVDAAIEEKIRQAEKAERAKNPQMSLAGFGDFFPARPNTLKEIRKRQ